MKNKHETDSEIDSVKKVKTKMNKWLRLFLFACGFVVFSVSLTLLFGKACPINLLTGMPCPSCGFTRAHIAAFLLQFDLAFKYNPLFFFSIICGVLIVVITINPKQATKFWFKLVCSLMTIALLASYVVRMIMFFPNEEPMAYNRNSLLGWILGLLGLI